MLLGILIGGVMDIMKVFRRRGKDMGGIFFEPRSRLGFQMLVLIVVAFLDIPLLGISISLALCTAAAMKIIGKHRLWTCGLTALGSAVFIHYVFGQALDIPLPVGLIGS